MIAVADQLGQAIEQMGRMQRILNLVPDLPQLRNFKTITNMKTGT